MPGGIIRSNSRSSLHIRSWRNATTQARRARAAVYPPSRRPRELSSRSSDRSTMPNSPCARMALSRVSADSSRVRSRQTSFSTFCPTTALSATASTPLLHLCLLAPAGGSATSPPAPSPAPPPASPPPSRCFPLPCLSLFLFLSPWASPPLWGRP